jgi:hypothetical protein
VDYTALYVELLQIGLREPLYNPGDLAMVLDHGNCCGINGIRNSFYEAKTHDIQAILRVPELFISSMISFRMDQLCSICQR